MSDQQDKDGDKGKFLIRVFRDADQQEADPGEEFYIDPHNPEDMDRLSAVMKDMGRFQLSIEFATLTQEQELGVKAAIERIWGSSATEVVDIFSKEKTFVFASNGKPDLK
ncbi:MAG: hypothetical protein H6867_02960 [Rhodospirillales bacterium]|nr:hypothetical protein [Rhodospirillales bacterium]MCB9996111.1 hypothetical protein [Rhodospirillales bacterium]